MMCNCGCVEEKEVQEDKVSKRLLTCAKVLSLCTGVLLGASIKKTDKPVFRVLAVVGMISAFVFAMADSITCAVSFGRDTEGECGCGDDCACQSEDDFFDLEDEILEDILQDEFADENVFF